MSLLTSLTNFKRALQKFVIANVGKVFEYGFINGVYWVRYTVVQGLRVFNCVTFISIKWLRYAFVELRQISASGVTFQQVSNTAYAVDGNNAMHFVHIEGKKLDCTCPDFERQTKEFGLGCCKHGYAILNTLGFSNLRQFIGNQ